MMKEKAEWKKLYIKHLSHGLTKEEIARMNKLEEKIKGAKK